MKIPVHIFAAAEMLAHGAEAEAVAELRCTIYRTLELAQQAAKAGGLALEVEAAQLKPVVHHDNNPTGTGDIYLDCYPPDEHPSRTGCFFAIQLAGIPFGLLCDGDDSEYPGRERVDIAEPADDEWLKQVAEALDACPHI